MLPPDRILGADMRTIAAALLAIAAAVPAAAQPSIPSGANVSPSTSQRVLQKSHSSSGIAPTAASSSTSSTVGSSASSSHAIASYARPGEVMATDVKARRNFEKTVSQTVAGKCHDPETREKVRKLGIPCPGIAYPGPETDTRLEPLSPTEIRGGRFYPGKYSVIAPSLMFEGKTPICVDYTKECSALGFRLATLPKERKERLDELASRGDSASQRQYSEEILAEMCHIPMYRDQSEVDLNCDARLREYYSRRK
jgi:hypothetical protein